LPFLANGLGIFLMVQQFKTLNKSLIEASKIDGCSHIFIYLKIVLPLSKGILSTWGIYSFLNIWNMYLWPLMISTRPESRTIQIGLKMIKSEEGTNFGVLMAAVVIVIIPSLVVLFLGQSQLQKGMTSGGVKE
ncbi:carbohydrate ABC transporter permease, partial [Cetobacterium sp.]